jgi:hypothetical protein
MNLRFRLMGLSAGLLLLLLAPRQSQAFYNSSTGRWISRDPVPQRGDPNLLCFLANSPTADVDPLGLRKLPLQEVVDLAYANWPAGVRPDINPCVMTAVLWKESSFDTDAKSASSTAQGIAQILDGTADDIQDRIARGFGGSDPFDTLARGQRLRDHRLEPDVSILAAYIYLDDRYRAGGSLLRALGSYGPNADSTLKAADCLCSQCGGYIYDNATGRIHVKDESAALRCLQIIPP